MRKLLLFLTVLVAAGVERELKPGRAGPIVLNIDITFQVIIETYRGKLQLFYNQVDQFLGHVDNFDDLFAFGKRRDFFASLGFGLDLFFAGVS